MCVIFCYMIDKTNKYQSKQKPFYFLTLQWLLTVIKNGWIYLLNTNENVLIYFILSNATELPVYIKLEQWRSDMKIPHYFTFYLSNPSISRSFSAVPWTSKDQESLVYIIPFIYLKLFVLVSSHVHSVNRGNFLKICNQYIQWGI